MMWCSGNHGNACKYLTENKEIWHNTRLFLGNYFLKFTVLGKLWITKRVSCCRVEPKRVIIKEGQKACNFYFILSGTVLITEWNEVTKCSQTKCMLRRGMQFGVSIYSYSFCMKCYKLALSPAFGERFHIELV